MWFVWLALGIDAPAVSLITPFGWCVLTGVAAIPMFVGYIASFFVIPRDFWGNDGCADDRKWPL